MSVQRMTISAYLLLFLATCSAAEDAPNLKKAETRIIGQALLNRDGAAHVYRLASDGRRAQQLAKPVAIDSQGNFEFRLGGASGDMQIVAVGGSYTDPADATVVVRNGRDELRANLFDVPVVKDTQIAINPWSDLLSSYGRAHPGAAAAKEAHEALEAAIGGQERRFVNVFAAVPSDEAPFDNPGDAEMAYIHLGAWSTLARSVSQEIGFGDRGLSTLKLIRALGESIELKGKLNGDVRVANGQTISANLLRQRFAQAMRGFVQNRPHVNIKTEHIKGMLESTSGATADMWGPSGTAFDGRLPEIELDEAKVLASEAQISCKARHSSGIASLSMTAEQDRNLDQTKVFPYVSTPRLGEPEVSLMVTFNPEPLVAGDVNIVCRATDAWGNAASKIATYRINKGGIPIQMSVEPFPSIKNDRSLIDGKVRVICTCSDTYPDGADACRLNDESLSIEGIRRVGPRVAGTATYEWDTTKTPDGEVTLTCQESTLGYDAPIQKPYKLVISNYQPLVVRGVVGVDSLVSHMRVEAWGWLNDGTKGPKLGEAEAKDGTFAIRLSNEYQGPVLFEATPQPTGVERASFRSAATMENINLEAHHRLALLWDGYTPAEEIPVLYINAATTLAEAYAEALIKKPQSDTFGNSRLAISKAHDFFAEYMFSGYVNQDEPFDVRRTPVASVTDGEHTAFRNKSRLLGLFHAGLSRLAAEQSTDKQSTDDNQVYSVLDFVLALADDFRGGAFLNGISENGRPIRVNQYCLNPETLRRDLAQAIHRWLKNAPVHGRVFEASQMKATDYARPGKFLRLIAGSTSEVFGEYAPEEFDAEAPELSVTFCQEPNGKPVSDPRGLTFGGVVKIRVDAVDDSLINEITVVVGDKKKNLLPSNYARLPDVEATAEYRWGTPEGMKEAVTVIISARDQFGNESPQTYTILIDNISPTVSVISELSTKTGSFEIHGTSSKPYALVRLLAAGNRVLGETRQSNSGTKSDFSLEGLVDCNARHNLAIKVTDFAGNESQPAPVEVICDNHAPVVELVPMQFRQEFTGAAVDVHDGFVFEKFLHTLDSDLKGRPAQNLPRLLVRVADQWKGRVGSAAQAVEVEWSYRYSNGSYSYESPWRSINMSKEEESGAGLHEIELSYQTLLPENVLNLPIADARKANFIAYSAKKDKHTIAFRARDAAGNVSQEVPFGFGLDIKTWPVQIKCSQPMVHSVAAVGGFMKKGSHAGTLQVSWGDPYTEHVNSLAPTLESEFAELKLGNHFVNWTIYETQWQRTVADRHRTAELNHHSVHKCSRTWMEWVRRYDDNGECFEHDDDTEDADSESSHRPRGLNAYKQAIAPMSRSVLVRYNGAKQQVDYEVQADLPFIVESDRSGRQRIQATSRTAVESTWLNEGRHGNMPKVAWVTEKTFVKNMMTTINWTSAQADLVPAKHFPQPVRVLWFPGMCKGPLFPKEFRD